MQLHIACQMKAFYGAGTGSHNVNKFWNDADDVREIVHTRFAWRMHTIHQNKHKFQRIANCSQSSFVLNLFLACVHDVRTRERENERGNVMLVFLFIYIISDSNKAVRSAFDMFSDMYFSQFSSEAIFIGNKVQLCAKTVSFSNNGNHYAVVPCSQPHIHCECWAGVAEYFFAFSPFMAYCTVCSCAGCWLQSMGIVHCTPEKYRKTHI